MTPFRPRIIINAVSESRRKPAENTQGKILSTKLMPPRLPVVLVTRPALFARLDEGLTKKLILVDAPTGFGKTTLISQWLSSRAVPYAWVTLYEGDNDLTRFWNYVIMALRTFDPILGKAALGALLTSQQPAPGAHHPQRAG